MLRNKTPAPDFSLPDDDGEMRALDSLRLAGKPLLLFFYRFEHCPTSHRDLLAYANIYNRLEMIGADMAAISVDPPEAQCRLKRRLGLPFPMLSDADFSVSQTYGIYESDETDEGPQPHGEPAVFLIDGDGNIAYSQVQTGPKGTADPAGLAMVLLYMANSDGRYW